MHDRSVYRTEDKDRVLHVIRECENEVSYVPCADTILNQNSHGVLLNG